MHGIGNDFIVLNTIVHPIDEAQLPDLSIRLNHRKFGIGGDGLILVLPSRIADFKMRMFNPDGSEAEMCGNGIRCFAKYLYDRKMIGDSQAKIETLAGVKILKLNTKSGVVDTVRVDMGVPKLLRSEIPMRGNDNEQVISEALKVDGKRYDITAVSMGNPHVIVFENKLEDYPVARTGSLIENHRSFPERTNVHFVHVLNQSEIEIKTWERGAGETLACGTGACACAVASVLNGFTGRTVLVHLPGGDLKIEWLGDQRVLMTGQAEEVFEGEVSIS